MACSHRTSRSAQSSFMLRLLGYTICALRPLVVVVGMLCFAAEVSEYTQRSFCDALWAAEGRITFLDWFSLSFKVFAPFFMFCVVLSLTGQCPSAFSQMDFSWLHRSHLYTFFSDDNFVTILSLLFTFVRVRSPFVVVCRVNFSVYNVPFRNFCIWSVEGRKKGLNLEDG